MEKTFALSGGKNIGRSAGDLLCWELDSSGTFTISGKGQMADYDSGRFPCTPWQEWKAQIRSLTVTEGVTGLGTRAFAECPNLKSVTLPESLEKISYGCFTGCRTLEDIRIPEGTVLRHIYEPDPDPAKEQRHNKRNHVLTFGLHAFTGTPWAISRFGSFYIKDGRLIDVWEEKEQMTVPEGVTEIQPLAFSSLKLSSVSLPESLTAIGSVAFAGTQLLTLSLPSGIQQIGSNAFTGSKLRTVNVTEDCGMELDKNAFSNTGIHYVPRNKKWQPPYRICSAPVRDKNGVPGTLRQLMIRKRKTGILRPHNGSVDCNDYIFTKLKAQNCLVTVQYFTDTRKVNVVQSYFWPEDREIIRTTTICPCINRDGDLCAQYIYDDVYSCDELEGSFTLEIAPEDQTEGPLISTDLTAKEQHFLSPDTDHFGLLLELQVLAEWIRMHPEYKVPSWKSYRL